MRISFPMEGSARLTKSSGNTRDFGEDKAAMCIQVISSYSACPDEGSPQYFTDV
jgi:hypothetical protein